MGVIDNASKMPPDNNLWFKIGNLNRTERTAQAFMQQQAQLGQALELMAQALRQLRCCRRAARLKILPPVWCCTAVNKYLLFFLVPDPIGMQSGRCAPRMRRGCSEARVLV